MEPTLDQSAWCINPTPPSVPFIDEDDGSSCAEHHECPIAESVLKKSEVLRGKNLSNTIQKSIGSRQLLCESWTGERHVREDPTREGDMKTERHGETERCRNREMETETKRHGKRNGECVNDSPHFQTDPRRREGTQSGQRRMALHSETDPRGPADLIITQNDQWSESTHGDITRRRPTPHVLITLRRHVIRGNRWRKGRRWF